ncbi:unnamed protein product [Rhizoctonia solani]|uniref:NACHT domain-containing protein n=1 Tax=Rhizoctonia solani TaxID=456999 RepID=A0A8H3DXZ4_9AGAM|nr:unnamed protein product [Rhizoctonia solani]
MPAKLEKRATIFQRRATIRRLPGSVIADNFTSPVLPLHKPMVVGSTASTSDMNRGIELALQALHNSAGSFAQLQDAILCCLDVFRFAQCNPQEYREFCTEIWILNGILQQDLKGSVLGRVSGSAVHLALCIKQKAKALNAARDENQISLEPILSLFRLLQGELKIDSTSPRLERLSPAKLAFYNSEFPDRQLCARDTCTQVLSKLADWAAGANGGTYWMTGSSGTGKTTIAATVSHQLAEKTLLGASFFCNRLWTECCQVNRIIPAIAYQLAHYSMTFRRALFEGLDKYLTMVSKDLATQFEWLLKSPLIAASPAIPKNLVIVLDGLDECDDREEVEILLGLLTRGLGALPVRSFITTRVAYHQTTQHAIGPATIRLIQLKNVLVREDITIYLKGELSDVSLSADQIDYIARGCGTSFIYAATLARSIRHFLQSITPRRLLRFLPINAPVSTEEQPDLMPNELYEAVLQLVLKQADSKPTNTPDLRLILMVILHAQELVDVDTISGLTGAADREKTLDALNLLRPLLNISKNGLISVFHPSFSNFLSNSTYPTGLFCKPAECSQRITQQCFKVMEKHLRFNICGLESSSKVDALVRNLTGRIQAAIPPALTYSCRYWGYHLALSPWSRDLQTTLEEFLSIRLLFWMEVMNLKCLIGTGSEILLKARQWLKTATSPSDLEDSLGGACRFVERVATTSITKSTPHIYISALLFCPDSNFVSKSYKERVRGLVSSSKTGGGITIVGSWQLDSEARSVAYSPNGDRIAFGYENGSVEARGVHGGFLQGHPMGAPQMYEHRSNGTGDIRSIALSPDGQRIALGSSDGTVRIRSVSGGESSGQSLKRHSDSVVSLAFSPDGNLVASGSEDHNIFIWNSRSGGVVSGPLEGHFAAVSSVTFSPWGLRLASGSWDKTIRVWDPHNGTLIAGPFVGHTGLIHSISFSPNGAYLVSGTSNGFIGIWDSRNGFGITESGSGMFRGHVGPVCSVAFSPDMNHIISASSDQTIKTWDIPTGNLIGTRPLYALVEPITSLSISPDRKHIASCSSDLSVQLWRATDRQITRLTTQSDKPFTKNWELRSDGWIVTKDSSLLLWVPPGIRHSLPKPGSDHICNLIGRTSTMEVNLSDLPLDERWHTCYRPDKLLA